MEAREAFALVEFKGTLLAVGGGYRATTGQYIQRASIEKWDPDLDIWTLLSAQLPEGRSDFAAVVLG